MNFIKKYLSVLFLASLVIPVLSTDIFSSPYIFTQNIAFQSVVLLMIIPCAWYWIWNQDVTHLKNNVVYGMLLFVIVLIASGIFGISSLKSFGGTWERFGDVIDWIYLFVYLCIGFTVVQWPRMKDWTVYTVLAVGVFASIAAIIQHFFVFNTVIGLSDRAFGPVGNPGFFAAYTFLNIGIVLYQLYRSQWKQRWLLLIVAVLHIYVIFLSETRAAYLALSVAISVIGIIYVYRLIAARSKTITRPFFTVAIIVIAVALLGASLGSYNNYESVASVLEQKSVKSRIINYRVALEGFKERPIFGWGEGNYITVFQRYYYPSLFDVNDTIETTSYFDKSHNEFLDRLVLGGIVGFISYLVFIAQPIVYAYRNRRKNELVILAATLLGYFAYLSFYFHSLADSLLFVIVLILLSGQTAQSKKSKLEIPVYMIMLAVCLSLGAVALHSIKPAIANILIRRAEQSESMVVRISYAQDAWALSKQGKRRIVESVYTLDRPVNTALNVEAALQNRQWAAEVASLYPYESQYLVRVIQMNRILQPIYSSVLSESIELARALRVQNPRHPLSYYISGLVHMDAAYAGISIRKNAQYAYSFFSQASRLVPKYESIALLAAGARSEAEDKNYIESYITKHIYTLGAQDIRLGMELLYNAGYFTSLGRVIDTVRTDSSLQLDLIERENLAQYGISLYDTDSL